MTKIATSFVAILSAVTFLQSVVLQVEANYGYSSGGGSSINYDKCACVTSDFNIGQDNNNRCEPDEKRAGSQARTCKSLSYF
jgi:hypothetical protein